MCVQCKRAACKTKLFVIKGLIMAAKFIEATRTPCTKLDFTRMAILAWIKLFTVAPKKESIAIIYAQWGLETGYGKSCWNWNIGNCKFVPSKNISDDDDLFFTKLSGVWEIINGKKIILDKENQGSWFKAFPSLLDGMMFHLDYLKNDRYKSSWKAIEEGNPILFAHLLKQAKYYTATESDYSKLMSSIFNSYMKMKDFEQAINELESRNTIPDIEPGSEPNADFHDNSTIWDKILQEYLNS